MALLATAWTDSEITSCSSLKNMKDAYRLLSESYLRMITNELLYCHKCDSWKRAPDFYSSKEYMSGKFPICKECLIQMAEQREKPTDPPNETEESVKKVLKLMNLPFHADLYRTKVEEFNDKKENKETKPKGKYDYLKKDTSAKTPFTDYVKAIKFSKHFKDQTWADGDGPNGSIESAQSAADKVKKETVRRFGQSYSSEDLLFLQNEYDDWVRRYECNTKAQEECFQRLAVTKLDIAKAKKKNKSTKELETIYKTWMDSANVTPRQNTADTTSQAQTFGTLIQKFEMENPIPEPDPELQDVDKMIKLMDVVLGHTCKAAGIQTGYNAAYEQFMKEYSVEKKEYQEDDVNSEIYSQLFGGEE